MIISNTEKQCLQMMKGVLVFDNFRVTTLYYVIQNCIQKYKSLNVNIFIFSFNMFHFVFLHTILSHVIHRNTSLYLTNKNITY